MTLFSIFICWCKPARRRRHACLTALPVLPVLQEEDDDGGAGCDDGLRCCGWFDSSHELQHGLSIREHATPDTLAAELPLASWLELHLSGWRGGAEAPA